MKTLHTYLTRQVLASLLLTVMSNSHNYDSVVQHYPLGAPPAQQAAPAPSGQAPAAAPGAARTPQPGKAAPAAKPSAAAPVAAPAPAPKAVAAPMPREAKIFGQARYPGFLKEIRR